MSIQIIQTERDGIITVRPHDDGVLFPDFDEVEIKDTGHAFGWAGKTPGTMIMQELGNVGKETKVIEVRNDKIVFEKL